MRRTGPVMTIPSVRRASAAVLGVLLAVGGTALAAPAAAAPPEKTAVIVQLTPGSDAAAEARRAAANGGGDVSYVYRHAFQGFAGAFTPGAIAGMRKNPHVALIEADGLATASASQPDPPSWGLDRIDDVLGTDRSFDYAEQAGAGVTAYVIDSGVAKHPDLDDRRTGYDTVKRGGDGTGDCNGHGTHVAGTIAGNAYGVAKEAVVVPVRVLGCNGSGTWSGVAAGIDWAAGNHISPAEASASAPAFPAVANLSLGGGVSAIVDTAVTGLVADGVTVAVAAGNDNADACLSSPARVSTALTVGATDISDTRASFSNWGTCLDLFAPGVNITSTWLRNKTNRISGTSMASPHVAGGAALLLSQNLSMTPADVRAALLSASADGRVSKADSPNNELLYVTASTA